MNTKPKVVILAGGQGMRLREETEFRPKPLVEIGGKPILWHIMKIYSHYGFNDFILCLGYKGDMVKDYFLNYQEMSNDFTIRLSKERQIKFHSNHSENDWCVTLVDTGEDTMTGARIKRIEHYIDGNAFMLTYGDGLGNIDIARLLQFHLAHKKMATVTGVRPPSRFGELMVEDGRLQKFSEKPQAHYGLINGGFFVFDRKAFSYLSEDKNCTLEREPLERLAQDNQLGVYKHGGYWYCMDTMRDRHILEEEWNKGKPAWKVWEDV